jgi:hypothetical protein
MLKICAVTERYIDGNEVYLISMQLKTRSLLSVRIRFFLMLAIKLFNVRFRRRTYMPLFQIAPKPGKKYLEIRNVCHLSIQILPKTLLAPTSV